MLPGLPDPIDQKLGYNLQQDTIEDYSHLVMRSLFKNAS